MPAQSQARCVPPPHLAPMPDLAAFWMPFTDNRAFKQRPRLLASARDMHYFTPDGRCVLDGTAGLWCVNAGHGRSEIVAAIQRQAAELDFAPTFQLGHPAPFELASRLAAIMPPGLDRVFFTNSGSEAVETALKIALAYHHARGDSGRFRICPGRSEGSLAMADLRRVPPVALQGGRRQVGQFRMTCCGL